MRLRTFCKNRILRFYEQIEDSSVYFDNFPYTQRNGHMEGFILEVKHPDRSSTNIGAFTELPEIKGLKRSEIGIVSIAVSRKRSLPGNETSKLKSGRIGYKGYKGQAGLPFSGPIISFFLNEKDLPTRSCIINSFSSFLCVVFKSILWGTGKIICTKIINVQQ